MYLCRERLLDLLPLAPVVFTALVFFAVETARARKSRREPSLKEVMRYIDKFCLRGFSKPGIGYIRYPWDLNLVSRTWPWSYHSKATIKFLMATDNKDNEKASKNGLNPLDSALRAAIMKEWGQ